MAMNCSTCEYKDRPATESPCDVCARLAPGQRGVIYTRYKRRKDENEERRR